MKILLVLILTFFALTTSANEETVTKGGKHKATYKLILDRYISTPEWNPESEKVLPLTIPDAVKAAQQWAANKWPSAKGFKVLEITLKQMVSGNEGTWWAYEILIYPEPWAENYGTNNGSEVTINMNGEVERYKIVGDSTLVLTKQLKLKH